MKSGIWRLLFLILMVMSVCLSFAQVTKMNIEVSSGNRGCSDKNRVVFEFLGGRDGNTVLASGVVDPPTGPGFVYNQRSSFSLTLNTDLSVRKVKNFRIRLEGENRAEGVFDSWVLQGVRLSNPDNRRVIWEGNGLNRTLDNRTQAWTSANWTTYDETGRNTKTKNWTVTVATGNDDLRDDSSAGLILVFKNGATARVSIGRSQGIRGNGSVNLPIELGNYEQSLSDLQQAYLFKSAHWMFGNFGYKFRYYGERDLNADDWDVRFVTLSAAIGGSRDVVTQELPRLAGRITQGVKSWSLGSRFDLTGIRTAPRDIRGRLAVFIDGEYRMDADRKMPEIHAYIRRQGETTFTRVAGRTTAAQSYIDAESARPAWIGSPSYVAAERTGPIYEGSQEFYQSFPLYSGTVAAPIEEVRLSLYNGPLPSGSVSSPYSGDRTVSVRGIWLGLSANYGLNSTAIVNNHLTLGFDLSRVVTLSRTNRDVTYRLSNSIGVVTR
jgi:hypothetical protein